MLFLREYQDRPKQLADYLTQAAMPFDEFPYIMTGKDGSYMASIRYRGPDAASRTNSQMNIFYAHMNDLFMRLEDEQGSAWGIHVDMNRFETSAYDAAEWNNFGSYLFDLERMGHAQKLGSQYETECTITLTFLPASDRMTFFESLLEEPEENSTEEERESERQISAKEYFIRRIDEVVDLLKQRMGERSVYLLEGEDCLTYLKEPMTLRRHKVLMPETAMFLDTYLADREIWPGMTVGMGYQEDELGNPSPEEYIAIVGIRGWPKTTEGGLIDVLNSLNMEYRWNTRAIPLSRQSSLELVTDFVDKWATQRKGIKSVMAEHLFKIPTEKQDPLAVASHADAKEAVQSVAEGHVKMMFASPTVTVWADSPKKAKKKAQAIIAILNAAGFHAILEKFNAFEAWLGSLPGQMYANVRQAPISSLNFVHITPLSGIWAGYEWCEQLKGPPLMQCFTNGSTPFRLSFYHGDVGHTKILGPNGQGKSVLLSSICYQFFRYPNARIFAFDKDRSIRACTLLCGGKFHDYGSKQTGKFAGLQPLANIHIREEREFVYGWLLDIYKSQDIKVGPDEKEKIQSLLESMAKLPVEERRLRVFQARMTGDLKKGLSEFVEGGPYGHLLDAARNELEPHHFHAFEMGAIMKSKALVPVLTFLFHWIDGQISQNNKNSPPTLILLDESWVYLDNTEFSIQFKTWLKTVRKFNVSVIFANQSVGETKNSTIEAAADDNCFTTVYLPNPSALEESSYRKYAEKGLNDKQIHNIAMATGKRDYWYHSAVGDRMFELGLGDLGVALAGSSSTRDHQIMDAIQEKYDEDEFVPAFLVAKGLGWAADIIQEGVNENYLDASELLGEEQIAA